MSEIIQTWPTDALDAVAISGPVCQISIIGSDEDRVVLEGELGGENDLEPSEQWLRLRLWNEHSYDAPFTLRLPRQKAWVIELSAGRGKVSVNQVQARLQIMLGKGDVHVADSRGIFAVACGEGKVELERCVEAEMPERPPFPKENLEIPPIPQPPFGKVKFNDPWTWDYWNPEEWTEWGLQFSDRARHWAMNFGQYFSQVGWWNAPDQGINLRLSHGDARLAEIRARGTSIHLGHGNIALERGFIENLYLGTSSGDIHCSAVMPGGDWALRAKHGNLYLALPADAQARLDAATRRGEIRSEIPLVRVARPGPEASHGGRMVGTLGRAEGKIPVIGLVAVHGDIRIETLAMPAADPRYAVRNPVADTQPSQPAGDVTPSGAPEETVIYAPPPSAESSFEQPAPAAVTAPVSEDPLLDILHALSEGKISVEEADKLLGSLS